MNKDSRDISILGIILAILIFLGVFKKGKDKADIDEEPKENPKDFI